MSDVIIKVGGSVEGDGAAFISAWKRAEAGEQFSERQVAFESWELLTKTLIGKPMELLRRVHEDVEARAAAGLLDKGADGLSALYKMLRTDIAL